MWGLLYYQKHHSRYYLKKLCYFYIIKNNISIDNYDDLFNIQNIKNFIYDKVIELAHNYHIVNDLRYLKWKCITENEYPIYRLI